jgi:hypothetical protein
VTKVVRLVIEEIGAMPPFTFIILDYIHWTVITKFMVLVILLMLTVQSNLVLGVSVMVLQLHFTQLHVMFWDAMEMETFILST